VKAVLEFDVSGTQSTSSGRPEVLREAVSWMAYGGISRSAWLDGPVSVWVCPRCLSLPLIPTGCLLGFRFWLSALATGSLRGSGSAPWMHVLSDKSANDLLRLSSEI